MKNTVSIIVIVVLIVFVIASFAHQVEWMAMGFLLLSVLFSLISYQLLIKHRDDFLSVNLGTPLYEKCGDCSVNFECNLFYFDSHSFSFPT